MDLESDQGEGRDLLELVASHLRDDQILVYEEAGSEKRRYCNTFAVAINADGDRVELGLNEIYARAAASFGVPADSISTATY
jgi:hypothetical protein